MLSFFRDRRVWVASALIPLALILGAWFWISRHAAGLAAQAVQDRLGLPVEIGDVDIGLSVSSVQDVVVRGRDDVVLQIQRVDVAVPLWTVMFARRRAQAQARVRGSEVSLRDADGILARVDDFALQRDGARFVATAHAVVSGDPDSDYVQLGPSRLELLRGGDGWLLLGLDLTKGRALWLRESEAERLMRRLRHASKAFGSSSPRRETQDASVNADPSTRRGPSLWLDRISPNARIHVSFDEVESLTGGKGPKRLNDLSLAVSGLGDGWFQVRASGRTGEGGAVRTDMRVMPTLARAEGSVSFDEISVALVAPLLPEIPWYDTETGALDGELELSIETPDRIRIEGRVDFRDLSVFSERLAANPVRDIDVSLGGHGLWFPVDRRLQIDHGFLQLGPARAVLSGELEKTPEHYRVELEGEVPRAPCQHVVGAIPPDILGSFRGFQWSGNWAATGRVAVDSRDLEATALEIRVRNQCQFERAPAEADLERFFHPFVHQIEEPDGELFEMTTGPGTHNWVSLPNVSPFLIQSVISHEDARFFDHAGFAPWAIRDALARNLSEGRYVVGASTISMQLAKNLFLQREKTLSRKAKEVILTWWLEDMLSKDQILELYLNIIEYGPGLYGLKNAARRYFGRPPAELSPAESAFLACILPSPKRYYMYYARDGLTNTMKTKMRRLLEHMAKRQRITEEALAYGLQEIEAFDFHQDGEPPPPARVLPIYFTELELEQADPWEMTPFGAELPSPQTPASQAPSPPDPASQTPSSQTPSSQTPSPQTPLPRAPFRRTRRELR